MKNGHSVSHSEGRGVWLGGHGSIYLGLFLLVIMTVLANYFSSTMGIKGLMVLSAGLLGAVIAMILVLRFPVWLCMIWFLSMSGFRTLGMLRMPGLPDFSYPRLFLVAVLLLIPLGIIVGRSVLRQPYLPDLLLISYTFYVFLNLNTIGDPLRFNLWLTSCFAPMVAYIFAKQYVKTEIQLRGIFTFFILVTIYFWVVSFGEHFEIPAIVWPRNIMDREYGNSWFGRSRGPFIQPALFGQIIGMYLIIHVFIFTRKVKNFWKVVVAINLGFGAMGLLYTYTRGGWLATAVGLAAMAALRPQFRKTLFVAVGIGIVIGSLGVFQTSDDEFLAERMETTSTIDSRLGFLSSATRMIMDHPVFGVGYFRFTELRPLYNQGTHIPFYGYVTRKAGAEASIHDIYIGRAAEEGFLGLFLFLAFYFVIAMEFKKRWKENPQGGWFDKDTLAMFAGLFVAYFVGGMVIDYRYFDLINILPAFFAGIIVGFPRKGEAGFVYRDNA